MKMLAIAIVLASTLLVVRHSWQAQDVKPTCAEIKNVLETVQHLKVGMSRKEVEQHLSRDGGMQFQTPTRYTDPDCNYIKIDIEFQPGRPGKKNEILSSEDVVVGISKPYLAYPTKD